MLPPAWVEMAPKRAWEEPQMLEILVNAWFLRAVKHGVGLIGSVRWSLRLAHRSHVSVRADLCEYGGCFGLI